MGGLELIPADIGREEWYTMDWKGHQSVTGLPPKFLSHMQSIPETFRNMLCIGAGIAIQGILYCQFSTYWEHFRENSDTVEL